MFNTFILSRCRLIRNTNEARQPPKVCARDLSKPWIHILRIWLLYRMGLAIENLAPSFIDYIKICNKKNIKKSPKLTSDIKMPLPLRIRR